MADRVEDALAALRDTPVRATWDEVVARVERAELEPERAGRGRGPVRWLAAGAAVAAAAVTAVVVVGTDDDDAPLATTPTPCGFVTSVPLTPSEDGTLVGAVGEQTVTVELPLAGAVGTEGAVIEHADVDGTLATLLVRGSDVELVADAGGGACNAVSVAVSGPSLDDNRALALQLASDLLPDRTSPTVQCDGASVATAAGPVDVRVLAAEEPDVDGQLLVPVGALFGCRFAVVGDRSGEPLFLSAGGGAPALVAPAVWPETSQTQFVPGQVPPDERLDASATAIAFAAEVLGWDDAEWTEAEPAHDGGSEIVAVVRRRSAPETAVVVRMSRVVGGRWWSVVGVGPDYDIMSFNAVVSVAGTTAQAWTTASEGRPATARFDYGGRVASGPAGSDAPFDLGLLPDTDGSVMVLVEDAEGAVVEAWGTPVSAGDFAAS